MIFQIILIQTARWNYLPMIAKNFKTSEIDSMNKDNDLQIALNVSMGRGIATSDTATEMWNYAPR